ncbi:MAG: [Fe-Fe] hydrogenase large subunit C-terminal domain-containing protein [Phycisphaerae bacterium]|jgi:anti-sigma regulatory factor (Ser/Thr protein kinase)/Na+-translocating ferredoxin:NAD+ oxidoreductase RNF subunit RnfB
MPTFRYEIEGGDYERGGRASRALKEQLKRVGADPAVLRRAMIAAYEAEMNVVIHAHRGHLSAVLDNGHLEVEVADTGPGIPNVEQALREGFSTASAEARQLGFGAGMGLPNIRKSADSFTIESTPGKGTQLCFGLSLRPPALYGVGRHSLHVAPERCRQSLRCLHACPTQAVRVFRGRPDVLDYLCIDCTACIAGCPTGTMGVTGLGDALPTAKDAVLVVSAESLAQFGADADPAAVLNEIRQLGFRDVRVTAGWEVALRQAVVEYAKTEAAGWPVISPACPAVVNLIETRFPGLLPHVAPFDTAVVALRATLKGERVVCVVSCPAQRTLVVGDGVEVVSPAALRAAVMPRLTGKHTEEQPAAAYVAATPTTDENGVMRVTGLQHVLRVLDDVEDGLAEDVEIIEPWACDEGCFGSPLLAADAYLGSRRWHHAAATPDGEAKAQRRTAERTPRPGLRLDDDMAKAVQKLARIDRLARSLPGDDCGQCGAPTCAALAEDIVLGRADRDACPRGERKKEKAE